MNQILSQKNLSLIYLQKIFHTPQERGQWQDNTYTPNSGDLIFFNWDQDGWIDHVGIVEKVENGRVYTIEGNSGDACEQNSYPLEDRQIYGYGILRLYVQGAE